MAVRRIKWQCNSPYWWFWRHTDYFSHLWSGIEIWSFSEWYGLAVDFSTGSQHSTQKPFRHCGATCPCRRKQRQKTRAEAFGPALSAWVVRLFYPEHLSLNCFEHLGSPVRLCVTHVVTHDFQKARLKLRAPPQQPIFLRPPLRSDWMQRLDPWAKSDVWMFGEYWDFL